MQELTDAACSLVNAVCTQLLLLAAPSAASRDDSTTHLTRSEQYLHLAKELQAAWCAAAISANHATSRGDQAAMNSGSSSSSSSAPSTGAAAADAATMADTLLQLRTLHLLLERLVAMPQLDDSAALFGASTAASELQVLLVEAGQLAVRVAELRTVLESPQGASMAGRFEWVDGSLTRAVARGEWVLLDNANLVNPTVLDRLNALLEPGGVLQLDEAGGANSSSSSNGGGAGRVVVPHPAFRLLLAYDPRHGEVSRAMRNRGVELCLLPPAVSASSNHSDMGNNKLCLQGRTGADAPSDAQQSCHVDEGEEQVRITARSSSSSSLV